jgi:hypothetical protein
MVIIDNYTIDATLSAEHSYSAEVTDFPIELGGVVTDHVILAPFTYNLQSIVSDTPLPNVAGLRAPNIKPSEEALQKLKLVFHNRRPVTVITDVETYDNMVMVGLNVSEDPNTGEALAFNATFRQVQIVENRRVFVRAIRLGTKKVDLGSKIAGFVGVDAKGRQITSSKLAPGVEPIYTREDGTQVSTEEAREAAKRSGAVLVKYDKNGKTIPVSDKDYQPYTPKQKKPFWTPSLSAEKFQ